MTSTVMAGFPDRVRIAEILASAFTPLKWLAVGGSFLLLLIGLFWLIQNYSKKQKSTRKGA